MMGNIRQMLQFTHLSYDRTDTAKKNNVTKKASRFEKLFWVSNGARTHDP